MSHSPLFNYLAVSWGSCGMLRKQIQQCGFHSIFLGLWSYHNISSARICKISLPLLEPCSWLQVLVRMRWKQFQQFIFVLLFFLLSKTMQPSCFQLMTLHVIFQTHVINASAYSLTLSRFLWICVPLVISLNIT